MGFALPCATISISIHGLINGYRHFTVCVCVCVCVWVSNSAEKLPESSSVRVPKIRTIFGVVGVLKLLAGDIA